MGSGPLRLSRPTRPVAQYHWHMELDTSLAAVPPGAVPVLDLAPHTFSTPLSTFTVEAIRVPTEGVGVSESALPVPT
jgi:hypothetical protein